MSQFRHALTVKRDDDFAAWYQEVISAADMAEESGVRGCMVIKPWGYGIWERIQRLMDDRIKAAGVRRIDGRIMSAFVRARKPVAVAKGCCAPSCCGAGK